MEKKKIISRRPELRFKEVFDQYDDCNEEDLFDFADQGDLTIYFQPSFNCEVGYFASIKRAALQYKNNPFEKLSVEQNNELNAIYPELKVKSALEKGEAIDVEELVAMANKILSDYEKFLNLTPSEFEEVIYAPPNTLYPNKGIYRYVYSEPIVGRFPLSPLTIKDYRLGKNAAVALKVNDNWSEEAKKDEEYFIILKPSIHIKEAIAADMLYVMKADLDRLCGLSPDENLSALFEIDNFPKELKIAITAWQSVQYSDQQGVRPSELIRKWLKEKYPKTPKAIKLSAEAVERITTVANWDTTPGRPKKSDTEKP